MTIIEASDRVLACRPRHAPSGAGAERQYDERHALDQEQHAEDQGALTDSYNFANIMYRTESKQTISVKGVSCFGKPRCDTANSFERESR
jgi:hypothetical protein